MISGMPLQGRWPRRPARIEVKAFAHIRRCDRGSCDCWLVLKLFLPGGGDPIATQEDSSRELLGYRRVNLRDAGPADRLALS